MGNCGNQHSTQLTTLTKEVNQEARDEKGEMLFTFNSPAYTSSVAGVAKKWKKNEQRRSKDLLDFMPHFSFPLFLFFRLLYYLCTLIKAR